MPLLNTVAIAGRNHRTVVDVFNADSAIATLVAAAGGEVDTQADFRDQILSVVRSTTLPVPVAEGVDKTVDDATVATPKYAVKKWPLFRPVTEEMEANRDPANLAASIVSSMAPRFPIGFDTWYAQLLADGANADSVTFNVAAGVTSLKTALNNFVTTTHTADGVLLTRLGALELGWNVDADLHRMDLSQALGIETALSGASITQTAGGKAVLGIIGPWGDSSLSIAAGMAMTRMAEATIDGKGPGNGYVNYRGQMAMGWGSAQASTAAGAIDGTGFTILIAA